MAGDYGDVGLWVGGGEGLGGWHISIGLGGWHISRGLGGMAYFQGAGGCHGAVAGLYTGKLEVMTNYY